MLWSVGLTTISPIAELLRPDGSRYGFGHRERAEIQTELRADWGARLAAARTRAGL